MINLSEKLKKLCKTKDFTQEQLAEYLGISPQAVSRWETGATSPDIFMLPQLAELFDITVDELLGIDKNKKQQEIDEIIANEEAKINKNITEEPIKNLRAALNKYPNNDRLLCCLMYALYAATEDEALCRKYDAEIVSIAYRIQQYSTDDDCRNEARRLLFRHYCDTNRKAEAMQIAQNMASVETCREYNIYWALEGDDKINYLKELMACDLKQLLWDIWAYETHAKLEESDKEDLVKMRAEIENMVKQKGLLL